MIVSADRTQICARLMRIWITDVTLEISCLYFEVFKDDKFCITKVYPFCSYIFSSNDKLLKKYQSTHKSICDLFSHTHFRYLKNTKPEYHVYHFYTYCKIKSTVFWDIGSCSVVRSWQSTWCHMPEGINLHSHCYKNRKCHVL